MCLNKRAMKPKQAEHEEKAYWWLAINGGSVAASPLPLFDPVVSPAPEQLLGFHRRRDQLIVQTKLLNDPIERVRHYMSVTIPNNIRVGRAVYRRPKEPEPPTTGPTLWTDAFYHKQ